MIFAGNSAGVLEFDGARWRLIPTGNGTTARSMDVSASGQVFVGAQNDLGYLAPDSVGTLRFVSLLDSLEEVHRSFGDVWRTVALGDTIYFESIRQIMRWDGRRMHVLTTPHRFLYLHRVLGDLYTTEVGGIGIARLVGDSLAQVAGMEPLYARKCLLYFMLPYPGGKTLLGTDDCGLFLLDDEGAVPFPTEADGLLTQTTWHGAAVNDSVFAIGTRDNGLVIIDWRGRVVQTVDKASGLIDNGVNFVYSDRQNGLWAVTTRGVSRVAFPSSTTVLDERHGLEGIPYQVLHHDGRVYLNTTSGLQTHVQASYAAAAGVWGPSRFTFVSRERGHAHSGDGELLYFARYLFRVEGTEAVYADPSATSEVGFAYSIHSPYDDASTVFVGAENGIIRFHKRDGRWRSPDRMPGVSTLVRTLASDSRGRLLLSSDYDGVNSVEEDEAGAAARLIPLTAGADTLGFADQYLFQFDRTIFLGYSSRTDRTRPGLLRYDEDRRTFVPDSSFGADFYDGRRRVFRMARDRDGNYWMRTRNEGAGESGVAWRRAGGRYEWDPLLPHLPDGTVYDILPQGDSLVWLAHQKGLFRFDRRLIRTHRREVPVFIRRVLVRQDSLLFGGAGPAGAAPDLAHRANAFRFEYAAAALEMPAENRYRTYLEGLDDAWSAWTAETQRDFTNLSPGPYRFRVRARDVFGNLSQEAVFAFVILPPWYRTWWAYLLYVGLSLAILIPVTGYYARRRLRRRVEQLEVGERLHQERQRISRDLHDHVGSQLLNILSSIEIVRLSSRGDNKRELEPVLESLDEDARDTVTRLRETIWAIHQEHVTVAGLGDQIRHFMLRTLMHRERPAADVTVARDVAAVELSPFKALNLFRIVQEAVTNSLKYAGAERIRISLERGPAGMLSLSVQDDGTFADQPAQGDESLGGHGLPGMRHRAEELGGEFTLRTVDGTTVRVVVPVDQVNLGAVPRGKAAFSVRD
jgi:two-component sensor histidine kinase